MTADPEKWYVVAFGWMCLVLVAFFLGALLGMLLFWFLGGL